MPFVSLYTIRPLALAGWLALLPWLQLAAQQKPPARKSATKPSAAAPGVAPAPVFEAYQLAIKPEYVAGQFALEQYLKSARLPAEVRAGTVQGVVQVSFVVQADGRLTGAYVARGLSAATNAEALRLVQAMPRWRPGRQTGKPVATRYTLLVPFLKPATPHTADKTTATVVSHPQLGEPLNPKAVYQYVEQMPEFPGGHEALLAYIGRNLKYPALALRKQVEGRVFVSFVVQVDGRVTDAKVQKGLGAGCDEEALRVIQRLPRFEPGKQNGQHVAVSYTVPVTFALGSAARATSAPPANSTEALPPAPAEEKIYTYVEQMPTLVGNTTGLVPALQAAVQLPAEVREGRTEGQVVVSFVVGTDGSVRGEKVVRSLRPACDEAALAAVRALPRFEPGKQNGRAVAVQLTAPVPLYGPSHVFEGGQVPTQASFPGGGIALREYFTNKLREPKVLKQENLRGTVEARFVVQADGRIGAAEIIRPLCRSCDEEALRLVRAMPRWAPARNAAGQPVAVRQNVRIPMPAPILPGTN